GAVVKAHPVPALLAATGLLWLYSSRNETTRNHSAMDSRYASYRVGAGTGAYGAAGGSGAYRNVGSAAGGDGGHSGEGLKERASHLGESALHLRDNASEKLHDAGSRIGESLQHARERTRERAMAAKGGVEHMLDDNPMAAGAIAVAVGALLGATVPTTAPERRMLRPAGEKLSHT